MKDKLDSHIEAYSAENIYDFDNQILLHWYPRRIVAKSDGAKSILELGLGHGFSTDTFAKFFKRQVVLEGSPAVINNFRQKYPSSRSEVIQTYFEKFETDEKFDVIVLGFVLEHVDDPGLILRRYRNFLTSNGKMFVAVPNAEVLNRRLGQLSGMLDDIRELSENDHLLGHKRYYTKDSLTNEVQDAGYKVDCMEGIYLKPFTTRQMISLNLNQQVLNSLCEVGIHYPELCCGIMAEISNSEKGAGPWQ